MNSDPQLDAICSDLVRDHGAHTILLYGSRADGSATEDSDYDLFAIGGVVRELQIARPSAHGYLDICVHPDSVLNEPPEQYLRLQGGKVLLQRDDEGDRFLQRLQLRFDQWPTQLSADELEARRNWCFKMLARARRGDAEGNYKRIWLLTALLEAYFALRGRWYLGPKKSLRWLQTNHADAHAAFVAALEPGASLVAIEALVQVVAGCPAPRPEHPDAELRRRQLAEFARREVLTPRSGNARKAGPAIERYLSVFRAAFNANAGTNEMDDLETGYDWCCAFVYYCCLGIGHDFPAKPIPSARHTLGGVRSWREWALQEGFYHPAGSTSPAVGDIVLFNRAVSELDLDHIGILVEVAMDGLRCAEGNNANRSGLFVRQLAEVAGYVRLPWAPVGTSTANNRT